MRRVCLVFLFVLTSACATTPKVIDVVKPGMTPEQVTRVVKKRPNHISQFGLAETWYYNDPESKDSASTAVRFKDGKVLVVETEDTRIVNENVEIDTDYEPKMKLPPDLGQACHFDSDCISKNCWLNQCSGPNKCLVPYGGSCVFSSDCCEGNCLSGICGFKKK